MAGDTLRRSFEDYNNIAARISLIKALSPGAIANRYTAYQALKEYDFTSFKYSDLIVSYQGLSTVIGVKGTSEIGVMFPEITDTAGLRALLDAPDGVQVRATREFGAGQAQNRLLLVRPLSRLHTAVFILDSAALSQMLAPSVSKRTDETLCVLFSRDGAALWQNKLLPEASLGRIFASLADGVQGKTLSLDGTKYIVSGFYIGYGVSLSVLAPVQTQFGVVQSAVSLLVVLCGLIMAMGIVALLFCIRGGYMPIAHLVRESRSALPAQADGAGSDIGVLRNICSQYSRLAHESSKNAALLSSGQMRGIFILRIICGQYSDPEELANLRHWLNIDFSHPCYFACILLFGSMLGESERAAIEKRMQYREMPSYTFCFCVSPDGRSAVGIVNTEYVDGARQKQMGEEILSECLHPLRATLGMGKAYADITLLGRSYIEAHAAVDYRLIEGKDTCITYTAVRDDTNETAPYPKQLLENYVACLSGWNASEIMDQLRQIVDYIHQCRLSLQQVKCICFELTSALIKEIGRLGTNVSWKIRDNFDVFSIAEYDSVSELAQKINDFSHVIQQYIESARLRSPDNPVEQCRALMEQNIDNAQFSLGQLAEKCGVTPQTLRRKFKEATGQTLSDYMTRLRIDRAKELLRNSSLDIEEICAQCGYFDQSSFIRLFKAAVGMPPGKFREVSGTGRRAAGE